MKTNCKGRLWKSLVNQARTHIASMERDKLAIAKLALEACHNFGEVPRGEICFETLKIFAHEVGLLHKTLYTWCRAKRDVWDKLPKKQRTSTTFARVYEASKFVKRNDTTSKVVETLKNTSSPGESTFRFYLQQARRMESMLTRYRLNRSLLIEARASAVSLVAAIDALLKVKQRA